MEITGNTAYQLNNDYSAENTSSSTPDNELGKDAFLQLLVTQLRYQDPLNPMANEDFIAQTAQFSSLEQMQLVNSNIETMNDRSSKTGILGLLGNYAKAESKDNQGVVLDTAEGLITNVDLSGTDPAITVDGKSFNLEDITMVAVPFTDENGDYYVN